MRQSNRAAWIVVAGTVAAACEERSLVTETPALPSSRPREVNVEPSAGQHASPSLTAPAAALERRAVGSADSGHYNHWQGCFEGFEPSPQGGLDVLRLGLLCGPSNGMLRQGRPLHGHVDQDGDEWMHRFEVNEGDCYRLFASASGTVEDLEVEVRQPEGETVELASQNVRWAVVPTDRPLCADESAMLTVVVRTHTGSGPLAVEVWRLRR